MSRESLRAISKPLATRLIWAGKGTPAITICKDADPVILARAGPLVVCRRDDPAGLGVPGHVAVWGAVVFRLGARLVRSDLWGMQSG